MTDAQTKRETARKPAAPKTTKPAGVKQPADRKPPADTVKKQADGDSIEVTVHGETFTVDRSVLSDLELLEDIGALDDGNLSRLPSALTRTLGPEQYRRAKELVRDKETGRVTVETAADFYRDLFGALNPSS